MIYWLFKSFSIALYINKINSPKTIHEIIKSILASPVVEKESLNKIVEIINPVFLISWLYLSVYWNDNKRIKTSAKIRIVKNSLKKR